MELKEHQKKASAEVAFRLEKYSLAYIFGPPRVGKSLIALDAYRRMKYKSALVLTKKDAIKGWEVFLEDYPGVEVTNYEKVAKLDSDKYELIIIDEAHNFSAFPRFSKRTKDTRFFCYKKDLILLSGTPVVEGYHKLYSQLSLSSSTPFYMWKNSYKFFREFGVPNTFKLNGRVIEKYDTFNNEKIKKYVEHLLVKVTFEDASIKYQNIDEVIWIDSPEISILSDLAVKARILYSNKNCYTISKEVASESKADGYYLENISALNQALHRICGGFYEDLSLPKPKLDWLKSAINQRPNETWVVMCYFIEEQKALESYFKSNQAGQKVTILSATKYCEGVDLSHFDNFVLFSFGYSGAKFVQLRDRIVNINKNKATKVLIPLLNGCLDSEIYKAVSNKRNFNIRCLNAREKYTIENPDLP